MGPEGLIIQVNPHRSARTQDLLMQVLAEWGVGLAVVAEPHRGPNHSNWVGDLDGSAAIYSCGRWTLERFEEHLDEVGRCVCRCLPRPVFVLGNFNAKSQAWGTPRTDSRGRQVLVWAAGLELRLINTGSVHTWVRNNGGSIVDLTWATPPAARRITGRRVAEEVESLSDHRYIVIGLSDTPPSTLRRCPKKEKPPPRWVLKKMDQDALMAAAHVMAWSRRTARPVDRQEEAKCFRGAMTSICDGHGDRHTPGQVPPKEGGLLVVARDSRIKDQLSGQQDGEGPSMERSLRLSKQRTVAAPLQNGNGTTSSMGTHDHREPGPPSTRGIVDKLFPPQKEGSRPYPEAGEPVADWSPELGVTEEEMVGVIRRIRVKRTAPGPDGIPGRAWSLALGVLGKRLRGLFTACLKSGLVPDLWKTGRMVLLRKEGRPADSPSAYRSICLLDEVGKMFEKIIHTCLFQHLFRDGLNLAECQYGFREGRYTIEAVDRVRPLSAAAISRGGVCLTTSLDVVNAFNTLPWTAIRATSPMGYRSHYLRAMIGSYLWDKGILYRDRYRLTRRPVDCGTLVITQSCGPRFPTGPPWCVTQMTPCREVAREDHCPSGGRGGSRHRADPRPGSEDRSGQDRGRPLNQTASVESSPKVVDPERWSLHRGGPYLESHWNFEAHCDRLVPLVEWAAATLGRHMPNLGGTGDMVRRLYMGVMQSMALYGFPIWAATGMRSRRNFWTLRRLQPPLTIRAIRGYRNTSSLAALALAEEIPIELQATRGELSLHTYKRVAVALLPHLDRWQKRGFGRLTCHITQVLSGYGCFGKYLCRIGREATAACHHCVEKENTAQHTLEVCHAFSALRRVLTDVIGGDPSLTTAVGAMLTSKGSWNAVATCCDERTVKHPVKVHVWGCFSKQRFGTLHVFTDNLNAAKMVKIYQRALLPSAQRWSIRNNKHWLLEEDNNPKHRSRHCTAWKEENHIDVLDWPSQSPDANPIENVWAIMKIKLRGKKHNTIKKLIRQIRLVWRSLSRDYAITLVESMPRRCKLIIDNGSDWAPY
nr:uncharacterized protein LOC116433609 [Nomia melanderi]